MTPAISACLIARDEEANLLRCLESLAWVDEIIVVVDARSEDGTEKLARERAQRVEVRPYAGDLDQKRFATTLATHDWVLLIDPDEEVPSETAREICDLLAGAPESCAGLELNRLTWHLGRWIRHGDFFPDWTLRVIRRSRARFRGEDPHSRVEVVGAVQRLAAPLLHYSYRDLADQIDRIQTFSEIAADGLARRGRRVRWHDLVLRPPARFLRAYLLKRGFRDGVPGLVIAVATAFHVFVKYAKAWEREHVRTDAPRS